MAAPSPPHLLVVDDDPSVREALAAGLAHAYVVHTAATGTEALARLTDRPLRGIILDVRLGNEDGLELLPTLRTRSGAPVIVLTGYGDKATIRRAFLSGAHDCLDKPLDVWAVRQAVGAMLGETDDPAARVKSHIEQYYGEPLTLPALAQIAGMSERQLQRRFSDRYGCSPSEHLERMRLRMAVRLRREHRLSLRTIAARVGYSDPRYLARVLRKIRHGDPPADPPVSQSATASAAMS